MSYRIVTTGAPLLRPQDRAYRLFAYKLEPQTRLLSPKLFPDTVGEVLDTKKIDCHFGAATRSPKTGRVMLRWRTCDRIDCSWCVVDHITSRVAPSRAFWGDHQIDIVRLGHDPRERDRTRYALRDVGLVMRWTAEGPPITAGVVSIPAGTDGERVLFVPSDAFNGRPDVELVRLRRSKLDAAIKSAVRAIPVVYEPKDEGEEKEKEPSDHYSRWPPGMTMRRAVQIAEAKGLTLESVGETQSMALATLEQWRALCDALWHG